MTVLDTKANSNSKQVSNKRAKDADTTNIIRVESVKLGPLNAARSVLIEGNRRSTQGVGKMVFKEVPKGLRASEVVPMTHSFRDSISSCALLNKKERKPEGATSALGVISSPQNVGALRAAKNALKKTVKGVQGKGSKKKQEERLSRVIHGFKSSANAGLVKTGKKGESSSKEKINSAKSISKVSHPSPNITEDNKLASVILPIKIKNASHVGSKPLFSPSRCSFPLRLVLSYKALMSKISKPKKLSLGFTIQSPSAASELLNSNAKPKTARRLNNIQKSKKALIGWLRECKLTGDFRQEEPQGGAADD